MPNTKDKRKTKVIEEEIMNDKRETLKKNRKLLITTIGAVVAIVLIIIFFATSAYESFLSFLGIEQDVSVVPKISEVSAQLGANIHLSGTDNVLMVYDDQGVTGYDTSGQWIWNEKCSVRKPAICKYGDYIAIADVGNNAIYTFNKNGAFWKYGIDNSIISVFCRNEYIGIIHEQNEYLSALTLYKYNEKSNSLDEIFTRKFSSHYMISGAISTDCKQIALTGVYSEGSQAYGIVSFLRMSDGEVFANEVTKENIYVQVNYANEDTIFASNSDSVCMVKKTLSVSSSKDKFTELWSRNKSSEYIFDAVFLNENVLIIGIVSDDSKKSSIKGYNIDGDECLNTEIDGNIIGMDTDGVDFIAYTSSHINMFNIKGQLIASQEAGYEILGATCYAKRRVAVYTKEKMLSISFE